MARVEGEVVIGRPADVVFDYVADQSNEPQYNPQMVRAEKITAGPVGKGTQFRSAVASKGADKPEEAPGSRAISTGGASAGRTGRAVSGPGQGLSDR